MFDDDKTRQLRAGTVGNDARAAAVELLINADLVRDDHPWVLQDSVSGDWTIDFNRATEAVDALTIEHHQWGLTPSLLSVLEIAASIADGLSVHLREVLPELDQQHATLVMTAIGHAAGRSERENE